MHRYILVGLLSYFLLFSNTYAAELQPQAANLHMLEEITVTATKREQKIKEIAGSVSITSNIATQIGRASCRERV